MPWTIDMLVPVREEMRDQIMAGSGDSAIRIYDDGDDLLATLKIDGGTVDGATGVLTLTPGASETDAPKTGDADHADIVNGNDVVLAADIPVAQGSEAVMGQVVISSTSIVQGGTVELVSAVIGEAPE